MHFITIKMKDKFEGIDKIILIQFHCFRYLETNSHSNFISVINASSEFVAIILISILLQLTNIFTTKKEWIEMK